MTENLYEVRVFGEVKGRYMKNSFDEIERRLKDFKFLNATKLYKDIPIVNRNGYYEQIYEARLPSSFPLSDLYQKRK